VITVLQMCARWFGFVFPGSTDYAGYCMAAASFFALAYAFNRGAHIRVSLVLAKLGRWRLYGEIWCYGIASALAVYFAWYAIDSVRGSIRWNDISQGQDATPMWIPQLAMAAGTVVLAIAVIDNLFSVVFKGRDNIEHELVDDVPSEF
jgi:TRAP-type C4-dicarboxylate transport system permease small subunit